MSSVIVAGNTSGSVTLDAPDVAGTTVITLPTASGTMITTTSGNAVSATTATTATTATNVSGGSVSATTGTFTGNVGLGTGTTGTTATPARLDTGTSFSNGTTRDKCKIYLYNTGTEQYGFSVGATGDIQYHSNAFHDTYIANNKVGSYSSTGLAVTGTVADSTAILRPLVSGASQATNTGATSYQFTGIPSWVKKITVMLSGVTRSGTTVTVIQVGSTTFTTSGYLGASWPAAGGAVGNSSGFGWAGNLAASDTTYGVMTITNISGNTWVAGVCGAVNQANLAIGGGNVTLSGVLDRVRVSSLPGTSTFSAGTINVFWE